MDLKRQHYKMYKAGKQWLFASILTVTTATGLSKLPIVHADQNNDHNYTNVTVTQSAANDTSTSNSRSANRFSSASATTSSSASTTSDTSSFYADSNDNKLMTSVVFNQNFHYNTPRGYSNDVQSILPHTNAKGKVDYYDIYYLYNPNPSQISFANEWYHVRTNDFKTFKPLDTKDPASVNNVAIPEPDFKDSNGKEGSQIASNNKNGIPWNYVATGSVIYNKGLLTKDQWGNKIDFNAKLAYFTSFVNNTQSSYLAYSNGDRQFHPYSSNPILPSSLSAGRDFFVTRVKNKLVGYLATGYSSKMYALTSNDGINWNYNSKNDIQLGTELGKQLPTESETPVIKTIGKKTFMFYSWHYNDYRGNVALSGKLDKNGIFKANKSSKLYTLDGSPYKGDTYAGNYVNIDKNTLMNINWSGNWQYSGLFNQYNFTRHSGTFALPRLVQYQNGQFVLTPIEPNNKLVLSYKIIGRHNQSPLLIPTNNKLDFIFDQPATTKTFKLTRADSSIEITIGNGGLKLVRNSNLNNNLEKDVTIPMNTKNIQTMQMYVDNSSIELYLPNVGKSYNIVNFSDSQNEPYQLTTNANATVNNYEFGSQYPSLSQARLIRSIKQLSKKVNANQNAFNKMFKKHYDVADKNQTYQKLNVANSQVASDLKHANRSLSTATSYIAKASHMNGDARASLYLALASHAYSDAATAVDRSDQATISANNLFATKSTNNKKNAQTVFVDGKQMTGKVINNHYYDSITGRKLTNVLYLNDGNYYYFDSQGNMVKNKLMAAYPGNNQDYYFGHDGAAVTGKYTIGPHRYYFGQNGIQYKNKLVVNHDDTLSYYQADGSEAHGIKSIYGNEFDFNEDGILTTRDRFVISPGEFNVIYYINQTGHVVKGDRNINGYDYHFDNEGHEYINRFLTADNKVVHYFDNNGHMVKNAYVPSTAGNNLYYYFDANGSPLTGPQTIDGHQKLFASNGIQVKGNFSVNSDGSLSYYDDSDGNLVNTSTMINGNKYNFTDNGKLIAPNSFVNSPVDATLTYYLDSQSHIVTGFRQINGHQYYFNQNGKMLTNSKIKSNDGKQYLANSNGTLSLVKNN